MTSEIPASIQKQVDEAASIIRKHLGRHLIATYLYGSALDGGLKPESDIDLFVVVNNSLTIYFFSFFKTSALRSSSFEAISLGEPLLRIKFNRRSEAAALPYIAWLAAIFSIISVSNPPE